MHIQALDRECIMLIGTFARNVRQVEMAIPKEPSFIDLRMDLNHGLDFREIKKLLDEHGVPCTLHLPSDPSWSPMDLPKEIVPLIDLGAELQAELVTFHTTLSTLFYDDESIDEFLEWVPLACDTAAENEVHLAVETLGMYYTEMALLFDRCPTVGVALDIGHGQIMAQRNRALELIPAFFDKIAMVNVHDNNGAKMVDEVLTTRKKCPVSRLEMREMARKYDTHYQIGKGSIDFQPLFRELKERSYAGRFLMMSKDPGDFEEEREKFTNLWLEA
ncbi:MAG: sugar phosphate isomerase/epimerase [Candidatus Thorarchaeota archaeon]|nr:sugar phosphate isomerase/epimerase [Candidatus Thorarchaeota archaeon]